MDQRLSAEWSQDRYCFPDWNSVLALPAMNDASENQPTVSSDNSPVPSESSMQVVGRYVTCALLLVVGLGMAGYGGSLVYSGMASGLRPTVIGEVVRTDVSVPTHNRLSTRQDTRFRPVVEYRYHVNGQVYDSSRLGLGPVPSSRSAADAQTTVDRLLNADGSVTVYYLATDPSDALIDPGPPPTGVLLLVVGLALAVLSAAGWTWYYRNSYTAIKQET